MSEETAVWKGGPRCWNRGDVYRAGRFIGLPADDLTRLCRLMEYVETFEGRPDAPPRDARGRFASPRAALAVVEQDAA
jgi:hypothetical protein